MCCNMEQYFKRLGSKSVDKGHRVPTLETKSVGEGVPSRATDVFLEPPSKRVRAGSVTEKMKSYKKNMRYNPSWQLKYKWIKYNEREDGMFCSV